MRITIDAEHRQVHLTQGAMLLTVQLASSGSLSEVEAAAESLRQALQQARVLVVNGEPIKL